MSVPTLSRRLQLLHLAIPTNFLTFPRVQHATSCKPLQQAAVVIARLSEELTCPFAYIGCLSVSSFTL